MNYHTVLKKCGIGLSAVTLCLSLAALPASAGYKKYRYYDGKNAFKQTTRDYGQRVGQGARNYYNRGKRVYNRYGRPAKRIADGVGAAVRSYRYRTPLPIIIVPKNYRNGQLY